MQQGIKQGALKEAREVIFTYTEAKLGYVPQWLKEKINSIEEIDTLNSLFREMIKVQDVEKFLTQYFSEQGS